MTNAHYTARAVDLLSRLIATPSVSRNEDAAAAIMFAEIEKLGFAPHRTGNNVWAVGGTYDAARPTVLLNAHIDTVKPVVSWTRDPFCPSLEDGTLYGLGSNDCGGGLVSLLQAFCQLSARQQPYNIIYLASAEEEVSGAGGIVVALRELPKIDVAVVGEPTGMQPAVAEKGLMVLDVTARGRSGHAARGEGDNAIYRMLDDLCWLRAYRFQRVSRFLGPTLAQATVVNAGTQHNVVPDECRAVVDVRVNEMYTNEEVFDIVKQNMNSEVSARSFRLRPSHIDVSHPIVERCVAMGRKPFGSPTLSDQALMPFPSLKLGPGDSARSHSADEYIRIAEISEAIDFYVQLLDGLCVTPWPPQQ